MRFRILALLAALAIVAVACSGDGGDADEATTTTTTTTTEAAADEPMEEPELDPADEPVEEPEPESEPGPYDGYVSDVYDDDAVWLCWPGNDDVCARNNDATIVYADGSIEVEPFVAAEDPAIDCFYVYPTISADPMANSDLVPAETEEIYTTWAQAARYQSACRMFAPMYPQNTLPSMLGRVQPPEGVDTREVAYAGVLDAWSHYMATENNGRGVLLLGHSQGAGMVAQLVDLEIDPNPQLVEQFVGVHILGGSAPADLSSEFDNIVACTEVGQVGCVVSYVSYEATHTLTDADFFGIRDGAPALCTNPASLDGSLATTQPYFLYSEVRGLLGGSLGLIFDPDAEGFEPPEITTPWVTYPDLVTAECRDNGTQGYLAIGVTADPDDPRTDDIGGRFNPGWGLHLVDVNVALGDLVDLVAAQAETYGGTEG